MKKRVIGLFLYGLLACGHSAFAGIVLNNTRVIYPEGKKEVTVRMENKNDFPSLVQSWIDKGLKNEKINKIDVPFVLLPPVARVEPQQGQTLRLSYVGNESSLPVDRESVFWLNVLDVPPQADNVSGNALQMAIRTRIKIFFRPKELSKSSPEESAENLKWKIISSGKEKIVLEVENNGPFYVSLSSAEVGVAKKKIQSPSASMIAPFGKETVTFPGSTGRVDAITYQYINDYGAAVKVEKGF